MTKDELLNKIQSAISDMNSREASVTVERNKDKLETYIRTWDRNEKYVISVKRME